MSSNLLKRGYTKVAAEETRVIDVNELMTKRMEEFAAKMQLTEEEGFMPGLAADVIEEGVFPEEEDGTHGNVLKASEETMISPEDIKKEAAEILENAKTQADEITQAAVAQAQVEKERILEQARQQGYAEGLDKAQKEAARLEKEFREKERSLEAEYQRLVDELEPQFVDTISGIYEHIFHVELQSYREILCHLISTTMRKVEGNRDFLIHVSKEDYPYVSMQKKQFTVGVVSANSTVEIVEDMTLTKNECLIETEGGIFDCGLGTQLKELHQKLKLLSYEK